MSPGNTSSEAGFLYMLHIVLLAQQTKNQNWLVGMTPNPIFDLLGL